MRKRKTYYAVFKNKDNKFTSEYYECKMNNSSNNHNGGTGDNDHHLICIKNEK